jgi:hypothetical protein
MTPAPLVLYGDLTRIGPVRRWAKVVLTIVARRPSKQRIFSVLPLPPLLTKPVAAGTNRALYGRR